MIRREESCWIKAEPLTQKSKPSKLLISIDNVGHSWNVYDDSGRDNHKIYLKGNKVIPSFCLKIEDKSYRIDFNNKEIKVLTLDKLNDFNSYVRKNCNIESSKANCWAINIYNTSNVEEYPFNMM